MEKPYARIVELNDAHSIKRFLNEAKTLGAENITE